MEFEKDQRASAQEIVLADAPHMSITPAHGDVQPDRTTAPSTSRPDNRNFDFETESTAEIAQSSAAMPHNPHRRVALMLAIGAVVVLGALLALTYLYR